MWSVHDLDQESMTKSTLLDFCPNTTHEVRCNMAYLDATSAIATKKFGQTYAG
jgi:hypothetical protein